MIDVRIRNDGSEGVEEVLVLHIFGIGPSVERHRSGFKLGFKIVYRGVGPAQRIDVVLLF